MSDLSHIPFQKRIMSLRKDYQQNIAPVLRRKRFATSKGQVKRLKHKRELLRLRRLERRIARAILKRKRG